MKLFVVFLFILSASVPYVDPAVIAVQRQVEVVYQEEIDRAMKHAPEGKSIYQLRGDAQKKAEKLFKKAAELYDIPEYPIGAISWNLRDMRAGAATRCVDGPPYRIAMNELLFLRNYDEMMNQTLPHEVAHIITCLRHPEVSQNAEYDEHGPEWQAIIKDLGGRADEFHTLDVLPITLYIMRVDILIIETIVENQ